MAHPYIRRVALGIVGLACVAATVWAGVRWDLSKSDWAAWIQAVGSVGAILVAVAVVQLQHFRELKRQSEAARLERRSKLNVLRWLFNVIADTCNSIAEIVGREHVAWHLQAQVLSERRKTLAAFPVIDYPDQALLLRAMDLTHRLQMLEAVVEALKEPRKESTLRNVADMLRATRDDALVSVTEATNLLARISTAAETADEWRLLDARDENRRLALKVWAEIEESRGPSKSSASAGDT